MVSPGEWVCLDEGELQEVCKTLGRAQLFERLELLAHALPANVRAVRTRAPRPLDQAFHDLELLNTLGRPEVFQIWLERAAELSSHLPAADRFTTWSRRIAVQSGLRKRRVFRSGEHPELLDARLRLAELRAAGAAAEELQTATEQYIAVKRHLRAHGRLAKGDSLGDCYVLQREIGAGGFASVWLALCQRTGQPVAVKVLHGQFNGDDTRIERFVRGAKKMRELRDVPRVVNLIAPASEDHGWHYFVMDFLPGGDLFRAVVRRDPPLPLRERLTVLMDVADALAEAHARGMVHRDVRPQNVLLDSQGRGWLTDFDLVAAEDSTGGTRTGAMGTYIYSAPEQLERPQDVTSRADVYALGVLLSFVLSGSPVPPSFQRNPERFIRTLRASQPMKALVWDCIHIEPAVRPANAAAFAERLRAVLQAGGASADDLSSLEGAPTAGDGAPHTDPRSMGDDDASSPHGASRDTALDPLDGSDTDILVTPVVPPVSPPADVGLQSATTTEEIDLRVPGVRRRLLSILLALSSSVLVASVVTIWLARSGPELGRASPVGARPVAPSPITVLEPASDSGTADARPDEGISDGQERRVGGRAGSRPRKYRYAERMKSLWGLLEAGKYTAAKNGFTEMKAAYTDRAEPHAGLGWWALERKRFTDAQRHFEDALRRDARQPKAMFGLAMANERAGRSSQAIVFYRDYLQHHPKGADAGVAHRRLRELIEDSGAGESGDMASPANHCVVLSDLPETAQEWTLAGRCYGRKKSYRLADDAFDHALRIDPNYVDALFWMADTASAAGNAARAAEACLRLSKVAPRYPRGCPGRE